jgi:hypothetical protein
MASNEGKTLKKDDNYNETSKQLTANRSEICGIASVPGLQYRSQVVFTQCPHCKVNAPTEVESGWNVKNYLFCYYYGCYWKCLQLVRGKDWTLKDATHRCSSCQQVIATYEAC